MNAVLDWKREHGLGLTIATACVCFIAVVAALVWAVGLWPVSHTPHAGRVLDHRFTPAHDVYHPGIYIPPTESCSMIGKSEECTMNPGINIPPYWSHEPDRWQVKLTDGSHEGWRTVPQAKYDDCPINEYCDTRA